jgi:hypothetical protein
MVSHTSIYSFDIRSDNFSPFDLEQSALPPQNYGQFFDQHCLQFPVRLKIFPQSVQQ